MNGQLERALDRFLAARGFAPKTCRHCKFHEAQIRSGMCGRTWKTWGCEHDPELNVGMEASCNLWEEKANDARPT